MFSPLQLLPDALHLTPYPPNFMFSKKTTKTKDKQQKNITKTPQEKTWSLFCVAQYS